MSGQQSLVINQLKPCPFCGRTARMYSGVGEWWVACDCDTCGTAKSSSAEAAAMWNQRVEAEEALNAAIDQAERERLGGDASPHLADKALVSTVRWTAVGEVLPAYGRAVAIWIPALKVVVRAYRDGTAQDGEDWRVSGIEGPRVAKELVTHWAPIPNGPLPPPDNGGAA